MKNQVQLIGHVTANPELKEIKGKNVVNISIGVDDSYKTKEGEKVERTDFINLTAWGKTAEIIAKNLKKGSKIMVKGKFKTQKNENEGVTYYNSFVEVKDVLFLDKKESEAAE